MLGPPRVPEPPEVVGRVRRVVRGLRAHPADRRAYVCAVSASTGAAFARTIDGDDVAALLPPRARAAYARARGNKGLDRDTGLCIVAALKFADGAFSLERCP